MRAARALAGVQRFSDALRHEGGMMLQFFVGDLNDHPAQDLKPVQALSVPALRPQLECHR